MIDRILLVVVIALITALFGILSRPVSGQSILPDGVSMDAQGTYIVQRKTLRRFSRTEVKAFKKLAEENNIKYKLVGKR